MSGHIEMEEKISVCETMTNISTTQQKIEKQLSSEVVNEDKRVIEEYPQIYPSHKQTLKKSLDSKDSKNKSMCPEKANENECAQILRRSTRILKKPKMYNSSDFVYSSDVERSNKKKSHSLKEMNGKIESPKKINCETINTLDDNLKYAQHENIFATTKYENKKIFSGKDKIQNNYNKNIPCNDKLEKTKSDITDTMKKQLNEKDGENKIEHKVEYSWKHVDSSTVITDEKKVKAKKRKKLKKNDSFEQYGIILPSFDEIMENKRRNEREAAIIDEYDKFCANLDLSLPDSLKKLIDSSPNDQEHSSPLLDCTHLTQEDIQRLFDENFNYMRDIFEGKRFSERHERFKTYNPKLNLTMMDLAYCPSIIVFSDDQKEWLINLLEKKLSLGDKHTEYLFKVLLPEICVKIFMDVHNMTKEEALDYLEWRPVDDSL